MPLDKNAEDEQDLRAIYRSIRNLGPAGKPALTYFFSSTGSGTKGIVCSS
ncbi:MAG: hypothetical protein OJF51_000296 [Nitrospira sp.]|nr:MAG: hypothetical protein OJF51_000296 [Nitrospira sp.]